MIRTLLLILKTLGDFFLDAKGDGDPMRFWAFVSFICAIICLFTNQPIWAVAGCAGTGIILFILAIWHEREPAKKPPANPTQGQVG